MSSRGWARGGDVLNKLLDRASHLRLRRRARVGSGISVEGRIWLHGKGRVVIGHGVHLDASAAPIELHAMDKGVIEIGDRVRVEGGASIEAVERVAIGEGSVLRGFCKVIDNNFHQIADENRHTRPPSQAVVIGPGADIGSRSIVLPGARLGAGVRLLDDTVVSRRVPDGVVLEGNPPRRVQSGNP